MIDRYTLALAAALFSTAPALAQTSGEPRTPTPDITQLPVTSDQQARIRELVARENRLGATVPPEVELRPLPDEIGLGPYHYALVGNVIVVVDPDSRSVIQAFQ